MSEAPAPFPGLRLYGVAAALPASLRSLGRTENGRTARVGAAGALCPDPNRAAARRRARADLIHDVREARRQLTLLVFSAY